ncbi:hypothetical protein CH274_23490 [Rhodococcus sp. 06-418-5]|uniref:hypothetical protein n=1 Tax=Rhodococcus sp. 06-418-5 TaxID=2022507 RepID=UPI000B9C0CD9|nr:hypothetical protein [Rhodococcus sp. 06-418-5]OZC74925.1 hypothetical protein CH274_23490 [Rhodococcus sp. 06-418-5]
MSDRPDRISSERGRLGGVGADPRPHAVPARLSVPLLIIAVTFIGALPFYVRQPFGSGESVSSPMWFGGSAYLASPAAGLYWLIALPVCIGAVALYCTWSERRSGTELRVRVWLAVSVGLCVATVVVVQGGLLFYMGNLTIHGLLPLLIMSVAVLVWGVALRSRGVVAVGVAAVAASLVSNLYNVENLVPQTLTFDSRFSLWSNILLTALVFVVGAAASVIGERSKR